MSYENQEWTEHVMYHRKFRKNCEHCYEAQHPRKRINIPVLGEKLRRMANNMEKIGEWVDVLDKAKKNNKKTLIF